MANAKILGFDLGAESGRGVLGRFDGERLRLEVIHRFANVAVRTLDALHWDVLRLHGEILAGMRKAASEFGGVDSVGIDTWGVDFALLGRDGGLLGNPRHYRDPHIETIIAETCSRMPSWDIYRQSGNQLLRINTLFQLLALQRDCSPALESAHSLLMMPDLFHYFLTGIQVNEYSNASTSQMLDPATRGWAYGLVDGFGLPRHILGTIVPPGTVIGPLRPSVASDTGLSAIPVIAPATHDTGSAFAAVPARGHSWACISSGTWSLMGAEISTPLVTEEAFRQNFTNEGGVGGTIRFLKNIMGLWLLQECRRAWDRAGKTISYEELARLAESAPPLVSLVDPDDASFMLPRDMPEALAAFCRRTGQPVPAEPGPVARCVLESLALKYRCVLENLELLLGKRLDIIHVVGGGSQNELLCQLTADACNRLVIAGPVEATAIGNVLVQAMGLGLVGSLAEAREVVVESFECKEYEPRKSDVWEAALRRLSLYLAP